MMGCGVISHTLIIGRYLGRPVIATSRIDKYDGEFVTFHYNRHEDDIISRLFVMPAFVRAIFNSTKLQRC